MARTAGGVALAGLGGWPVRAPGASLAGGGDAAAGRACRKTDFLGACIRCGLCVRDCPYDTLKLATLGDAVATGTPYFIARDIPCEMCEDIPCVKACPTGALDHALTDIDDARMGLAVLIDQENCLNFQGLRCDVCYRVCPSIDKAITLERAAQRSAAANTRCSFRWCIPIPAPAAASAKRPACWNRRRSRSCRCIWPRASWVITIAGAGRKSRRPAAAWYRPISNISYNLPEGQRYDFEGEGLIFEQPVAKCHFADDPLSTLNARNRGAAMNPYHRPGAEAVEATAGLQRTSGCWRGVSVSSPYWRCFCSGPGSVSGLSKAT